MNKEPSSARSGNSKSSAGKKKKPASKRHSTSAQPTIEAR